jgi:PAS domain S-box-containing protein
MLKEKTFLESELQQTKKDLGDLERYIDEFYQFLPLPVSTISPINIIIEVNQAFQHLTGYNEIEITGKSLIEFFLEKKEIENLFKKVHEKKEIITTEFTLISKQKKEIPVNVSIGVRKDDKGSFIGYFVSFTDITEIKKFHQELEEKVKTRTKDLEESRIVLMSILEDVENSRKALINMLEDIYIERIRTDEERKKTEAIIYNFSDGLLFFDNEKILRIFNPQAEIYFKIKTEKIINKNFSELKKFSELKTLLNFLKNKQERIFRQELELEEYLTLEISSFFIFSMDEQQKQGTKIGNLIIVHDITREKQIEKTKSEFVSITAHQLRTPLSGIKWTLQMLLDNDLGEITTEQRDFIQKTYKANERMITVINDLLNITRIEEGRFFHELMLVNIEAIINEVVTSSQKIAEKKGINLKFQKSEEKLPQVKVDVEKIKMAVQNLIENAIQYTLENGEVTISLKYVNNNIEIKVKDTGIGISKEQQKRLFTKFFRAPEAIALETDGSGLGLFITKNIIEAHNGKIWFESEKRKGSTFYFTLPVEK